MIAGDRTPNKKQREKSQRRQELDDLRFVLASVQGRRVLWRLIHHFRPLQNMWHPQASQMGLNAAMHDDGLFMISEVEQANPEAMLLMATEFRAKSKLDDAAEQADELDAKKAQTEEEVQE